MPKNKGFSIKSKGSPTKRYSLRRLGSNENWQGADDKQLIVWEQVHEFFLKFGNDKTFRIQDIHWQTKKRIVRIIRERLGEEWSNVRVDFMVSSIFRIGGFILSDSCVSAGLAITEPDYFPRTKRWE